MSLSDKFLDRIRKICYNTNENGSPIGMKYRSQYYAEGVFDCYFFEKNLQGDIVAVYNDEGAMIGAYAYDAWGNERRNMFVDIFVLTGAFLMFFFLIRAEMAMVIHKLIKKPQHRRKRTEGQSELPQIVRTVQKTRLW